MGRGGRGTWRGLAPVLAIWLGLGVLVSSAPPGCGDGGALDAAPLRGPAAEEGGRRPGPSDEQLMHAVSYFMLADDALPARGIEVAVQDGVATLTGSVRSLIEKRRAVDRALGVRGVRAVGDKLVVSPSERRDDGIASEVRNALAHDAATDSYGLRVEVSRGRVVLSGTVGSWQEAQLAEVVAGGVRGVTAVTSTIAIRPGAARTDDRIREDVLAALRRDRWLDESRVGVDVEGGRVTLTGAVKSGAEHQRARAAALVEGVQRVYADHLSVRPWTEDWARQRTVAGEHRDEQVRADVLDSLAREPRTRPFELVVTVAAGIATLSGTVDGAAARRAAERAAMDTVGVYRVDDLLRVRLERQPSDAVVRDRVAAGLASHPFLERQKVVVEVAGGTIRLRGVVDSEFEGAEAVRIASSVEGVTEVTSFLDVPSRERERHDEGRLRLEILDRLFWSPWVDSARVRVEVRARTATLSGRVGGFEAHLAAVDAAYEAGALAVVSRLGVDHGPAWLSAGPSERPGATGR